jgi:hypothetical protein
MALTRLNTNAYGATVDLTSNVTGTLPAGNGGTATTSYNPASLVKIAETNITSNTASTEFTGLSATYKTYAVFISRLVPQSADQVFKCQMRDASDGAYETADYAFTTSALDNGGTARNDYSTSAAHIGLLGGGDGMGDGSGEYGTSCVVYLNDFYDSGMPPSVYGNGTYSKESGYNACNYYSGTYRDTSIEMDGIKFFFLSGDIAQGNFRLYGVVDA